MHIPLSYVTFLITSKKTARFIASSLDSLGNPLSRMTIPHIGAERLTLLM